MGDFWKFASSLLSTTESPPLREVVLGIPKKRRVFVANARCLHSFVKVLRKYPQNDPIFYVSAGMTLLEGWKLIADCCWLLANPAQKESPDYLDQGFRIQIKRT